jgi:hypothetical protein
MPLQERVLRLQQLPDKQGILISAGKQHLGNLAMTLHVSVLISQQYKVAVMVSISDGHAAQQERCIDSWACRTAVVLGH